MYQIKSLVWEFSTKKYKDKSMKDTFIEMDLTEKSGFIWKVFIKERGAPILSEIRPTPLHCQCHLVRTVHVIGN